MFRNCRRGVAAIGLALACLAASAEPLIMAAAEDDGDLLIIGRDFGPAPSVRLGELLLHVNGSSNLVVRAALPPGIEPGSYALTVSRNMAPKMSSQPFEVTLGAVGPRGEKGEKGDKGDPGMIAGVDSLAGVRCRFNGAPGLVEVGYGRTGAILLRCRVAASGATAP